MNHIFGTMKVNALFLILFFSLNCLFSFTQVNPTSELVIGQKYTLQSKILQQDRILNIYLPPEYDAASDKTYPVIYVLDGSIDEDFLHIMGIVQFESYPWINAVPSSIVVGISNIDRKHDFTFPTTIEKDKADFPTTGGSEKFIEFLSKELQPFIEGNYKVNDTSTIIGQSLGGLLATEILFTHPDMFTHYLIVSPSLWWDKESLFNRFSSIPSNLHVHIAVGKEGKVMVADAKRLAKTVKADCSNVSFEYFKNNNHADILHEAAFSGLKKLFAH